MCSICTIGTVTDKFVLAVSVQIGNIEVGSIFAAEAELTCDLLAITVIDSSIAVTYYIHITFAIAVIESEN